jgi:hypothetical protein
MGTMFSPEELGLVGETPKSTGFSPEELGLVEGGSQPVTTASSSRPNVGPVRMPKPRAEDASIGSIHSGINEAIVAGGGSVVDTLTGPKAVGEHVGKTLGVPAVVGGMLTNPLGPANPLQIAQDIGLGRPVQMKQGLNQALPMNPNAGAANVVGRLAGAAPMLAASAGGSVPGAAVGAFQGLGSAMNEGEEQGWSNGQTTAIAAERAIFNSILGAIPGSKVAGEIGKKVVPGIANPIIKATAGKFLPQAGIGAVEAGTTNAIQIGVEAEIMRQTGLSDQNGAKAIIEAAKTGDFWAQMVLFGAVRGTVQKMKGQSPAETGAVKSGDSAPAPSEQGSQITDVPTDMRMQFDQMQQRMAEREQQPSVGARLTTDLASRGRQLPPGRYNDGRGGPGSYPPKQALPGAPAEPQVATYGNKKPGLPEVPNPNLVEDSETIRAQRALEIQDHDRLQQQSDDADVTQYFPRRNDANGEVRANVPEQATQAGGNVVQEGGGTQVGSAVVPQAGQLLPGEAVRGEVGGSKAGASENVVGKETEGLVTVTESSKSVADPKLSRLSAIAGEIEQLRTEGDNWYKNATPEQIKAVQNRGTPESQKIHDFNSGMSSRVAEAKNILHSLGENMDRADPVTIFTKLREIADKFHKDQGGAVDFSPIVRAALKVKQWGNEHIAMAAHWVSGRAKDIRTATKELLQRFGAAIKPYINKIWHVVNNDRGGVDFAGHQKGKFETDESGFYNPVLEAVKLHKDGKSKLSGEEWAKVIKSKSGKEGLPGIKDEAIDWYDVKGIPEKLERDQLAEYVRQQGGIEERVLGKTTQNKEKEWITANKISQLNTELDKIRDRVSEINRYAADQDPSAKVPAELNKEFIDLLRREDELMTQRGELFKELKGAQDSQPKYENQYNLPGEIPGSVREFVFSDPKAEKHGDNNSHYDDVGNRKTIGWARTAEYKEAGTGEKVLVVNEFQESDRIKGIKKYGATDTQAQKTINDEIYKLQAEVNKLHSEYEATYIRMSNDPYVRKKNQGGLTAEHYKELSQLRDALSVKEHQITKLEEQLSNFPPPIAHSDTWSQLIARKMLKYAVDNGYKKLAWTTGDMQAERWNKALAEQVDTIKWEKHPERAKDASMTIHAYKDGSHLQSWRIDADAVSDYVGIDVAKQIKESTELHGDVTGDNLKIGGHGFREFYDLGGKTSSNVANYIEKFARKEWGGKVERTKIQTGKPSNEEVVNVRATSDGEGGWSVHAQYSDDPAGPSVWRLVDGFETREAAERLVEQMKKKEGSDAELWSVTLPEKSSGKLSSVSMFSGVPITEIPKLMRNYLELGKWSAEHTLQAAKWLREVGGEKIKTLSQAAVELVRNFGSKIKPYVKAVWEELQRFASNEEGSQVVPFTGRKAESQAQTAARLGVAKEKIAEVQGVAQEGIFALTQLHGTKKTPQPMSIRLTNAPEVAPRKGALGTVGERMLDSFRVFDRQFGDKAPAVRKVMIEDIGAGEDGYQRTIRHARDSFLDKAKGKGISEDNLHKMQVGKRVLDLPSGKITLTPNEIATVVANYTAPYNKEAITKHGIGIKRIDKALSPADAERIVSLATSQEKALAQVVKDVFHELWPRVREAYKKHTGKDLKEYEQYYLMEYFHGEQQVGVTADFKSAMKAVAEGLSLVQDREGAGSPVQIRSILDMFNDHIRKASVVENLMEPTRNAMMLFGNPEFRRNLIEKFGSQAVGDVNSTKPNGYWTRYIADSSRLWDVATDTQAQWWSRTIQRNFASTKLWGRVSSVLKQGIDLGNMAVEFTGHTKEYLSGLRKSLTTGDSEFKAALDKYSGTLYNRYFGNLYHLTTPATEGGQSIISRTKAMRAYNKVREGGLAPLEWADRRTGKAAWYAMREIVGKEMPQLKGDAFEKEVMRRTTLAVEKAQNPTSPQGQSDIARQVGKIPFASWALTFTSPGNKSLNLVVQEITRAQRGDVGTAAKNLAIIYGGKAVAASISTALGAAGLNLAIKSLKGTEEKKDKERFDRAVLLNVVRELGGDVYLVGDALDQVVLAANGVRTNGGGSLPQGGIAELEKSVGDFIGVLTDETEKYTKAGQEKGSEKLKASLIQLMKKGFDFGGIPGGSFSDQISNVTKPAGEENPVKDFATRLRNKENPELVRADMAKQIKEGKLTRDQAVSAFKRNKLGDELWEVEKAPLNKALEIWASADKSARARMFPYLVQKLRGSDRLTSEEKKTLLERLKKEKL